MAGSSSSVSTKTSSSLPEHSRSSKGFAPSAAGPEPKRFFVAAGDTQPKEGVGEAVDPLGHLHVGDALPLADQGLAVRHHHGADLQELGRVHFFPQSTLSARCYVMAVVS